MIASFLVAAVIAWQAPRLYAEERAFSSRRHAEVLQFMQQKLPSSSAILVDDYNTLGPSGYARPEIKQRTLQPSETLASLRAAGFTHVLVTSRQYPAFSPDSRRASGLSADNENKMRSLYSDIFSRCRLVSEWKAGKKKQLEPEFRLYELPQ